jgi:chitinase
MINNYFSKSAMSNVSSEVGQPLIAWNQQAGGDTFRVLFNGFVYRNTYWVERWHCPGQSDGEGSPHNAWERIRAATPAEIAAHGNPTECRVDPTTNKTDVLIVDSKTQDTYAKVGFRPDASGTHLSYTSARVAKPMYNKYQTVRSKPKVSAYITDWCQYDRRLDSSLPGENEEHSGRGFDLSTIPPTAYDRLIFSFMGICGDTGEKQDKIDAVWNGWNSQVAPGDAIGRGHIVPVDPYADLATDFNVGLPSGSGDNQIGPTNFLQRYSQQSAAGLLGGLRELQKKAHAEGHSLELAFSIGGWSLSRYFSALAADADARRVFVGSVVDFFVRFPMFKAVDIDWEYPTDGGLYPDSASPDDGKNYAYLIRELRTALDEKFGNRVKQITIAAGATIEKLDYSNIPGLIESGLDNIFLMSYDFFGTGWATHVGHHTNLKSDRFNNPSTDIAIQHLLEMGVPPSMIHLGYANYGRSCVGANLLTRSYTTAGNALGTFEKGAPEFFDVLQNYLHVENELCCGKNGFELLTDTHADADILFNSTGGHYISVETPRTAKLKGEYVTQHALGGIFSWSGDQDNGLLLNAAREGAGYEAIDEVIDMGPLYNPGRRIVLGESK